MALLLPLILIGISTVWSLAYNYTIRLRFKTTHRSKIIAAHAFAIEGLQIFMALITVVSSWNSFRSSIYPLPDQPTANIKLHLANWLAAVAILATHSLGVLAIDAIDNLVQIGTSGHPFQPQVFLLTRSVLFPQTIRRRPLVMVKTSKKVIHEARGRSRTTKAVTSSVKARRASSQPVTPMRLRNMAIELPSETRNALARANQFGKRLDKVRFRARTISSPTHAPKAANMIHDRSPFRNKPLRLSNQVKTTAQPFSDEAKPAETTSPKSELMLPIHNTGESPGLGSEDTISSTSTHEHRLPTPVTPESLMDEVWTGEHSSVDSLGNSCILRPRPRAFSTKQNWLREGMSLDGDGSIAIRNGRVRGNSVKEKIQHFDQGL